MATVQEILAEKGPQVLSIGPEASVLDAALLMNEHKVGALVVTEKSRVAGMFTERDVLRRVVGERRDPGKTPVGQVMTAEVFCCMTDSTIEEVRTIMKDKRIRHLPVVDHDSKLKGMISIGDLNAFQLNGQEVTIQYLREYIYGFDF